MPLITIETGDREDIIIKKLFSIDVPVSCAPRHVKFMNNSILLKKVDWSRDREITIKNDNYDVISSLIRDYDFIPGTQEDDQLLLKNETNTVILKEWAIYHAIVYLTIFTKFQVHVVFTKNLMMERIFEHLTDSVLVKTSFIHKLKYSMVCLTNKVVEYVRENHMLDRCSSQHKSLADQLGCKYIKRKKYFRGHPIKYDGMILGDLIESKLNDREDNFINDQEYENIFKPLDSYYNKYINDLDYIHIFDKISVYCLNFKNKSAHWITEILPHCCDAEKIKNNKHFYQYDKDTCEIKINFCYSDYDGFVDYLVANRIIGPVKHDEILSCIFSECTYDGKKILIQPRSLIKGII